MSRFADIVAQAREHVNEQSIDDVKDRMEGGKPFALIDVREDREWASAHITGATHIGKGVLERDIEGAVPALDAPIVLYCGGGVRSILAAEALQHMGYTQVISMAGGFGAWKDAGYPVSTSDV